MNAFMLQHELAIRLVCFFGVFFSMSLWELVAPRRQLTVSKLLRWVNNLALVVLNSVLLRVLFPVAAVGVAVFATQQGWGREETLRHLALKAGLPPDAWREGARFAVFSSRTYEAPLIAAALP